jgi:hypothetical protein
MTIEATCNFMIYVEEEILIYFLRDCEIVFFWDNWNR